MRKWFWETERRAQRLDNKHIKNISTHRRRETFQEGLSLVFWKAKGKEKRNTFSFARMCQWNLTIKLELVRISGWGKLRTKTPLNEQRWLCGWWNPSARGSFLKRFPRSFPHPITAWLVPREKVTYQIDPALFTRGKIVLVAFFYPSENSMQSWGIWANKDATDSQHATCFYSIPIFHFSLVSFSLKKPEVE